VPERSIAIVHYSAPPVTGGVESVIGEQARRLRARGHVVRILAGRGDCELVPEFDSRHPDVEEIAIALAEGNPSEHKFTDLQRRLGAELETHLEGVQVVIAHNVLTMPFNLALAAALTAARVAIVAWTHDLAWTNPRYQAYHRDGWPYSILREAHPRVRYVVISEARRQEAAALFSVPAESIPVIPNGIDPWAFLRIDEKTQRLLHQADLIAADPLLLVPFRITPRKRLELALEAAADLLSRHPGIRLVIAGPLGPHSAENRSYARDLLDLRRSLGLERAAAFLFEQAGENGEHPVDQRVIADLYQLADAVILPSESEGFGLPVLEGALARAPVVCAGIPVLMEAGGDGIWTFPTTGTGSDLAQAIEQALASRAARLRSSVLRRYKWDSVIDQTEALIEEVLGS
jgi:glycosyltransferase involved in cell wall biosynthesis